MWSHNAVWSAMHPDRHIMSTCLSAHWHQRAPNINLNWWNGFKLCIILTKFTNTFHYACPNKRSEAKFCLYSEQSIKWSGVGKKSGEWAWRNTMKWEQSVRSCALGTGRLFCSTPLTCSDSDIENIGHVTHKFFTDIKTFRVTLLGSARLRTTICVGSPVAKPNST